MPTARTPRTRATAAPARKPRAPRSAEPAAEPPAEVTAAEAQEGEAVDHYVTAALCGESIRIIPQMAWRLSWQRQLRLGQTDLFLENVVHPDDLDFVTDELDPTGDELSQFINDANALAGESLGKSGGPSRSSRRTRSR